MLSLQDILVGGVVPALIAAVILAVAMLLPRRDEWAGPLAVALAFAAAFPAVASRFPRAFMDGTAEERLFFLAIPIAAVSTFVEMLRLPRWGRLTAAVATFGILLPLVLDRARESWTLGGYCGLLAALLLVLTLCWWCLDAACASRWRATAWWAVAGIILGAAVLLMLSGVRSYGQYVGGALAAILAKLALLPMGLRPQAIGGVPLVVVAIVGTLLAAGTEPLFGYATVSNAALVAAGPVALWLGGWIGWNGARAWQLALLRVTLTAAPVAAGVAVAGWQFARSMADASAGA